MGVAAYHLVGDGRDHVAEIEQAGFLGHTGVKHHLEQQIAQLARQCFEVAILDHGGDLIGFLDGIGRDGGEALGAVPRAAAGPAQPRHNLQQGGDVAGGLGLVHASIKMGAVAGASGK